MNNPDHISWSLETIFWVKILQFFDADLGSGMENIRIWDGKKSDPGTGIEKKIPDPQHWSESKLFYLYTSIHSIFYSTPNTSGTKQTLQM
jgi:hypothetical protein